MMLSYKRSTKRLSLFFLIAALFAFFTVNCSRGVSIDEEKEFVEVPQTELVRLEITPRSMILPEGVVVQYNATAVFTDNHTEDVTETSSWSLSNGNIMQILPGVEKGKLQSGSPGSCNVQAALRGVSGYADVQVTPTTLLRIEISPLHANLPMGTQYPFTAMGVYSNGSVINITNSVIWWSTNDSVATISNHPSTKGKLTSHSPGGVTISASLGTVQSAMNITITAATLQSITVTPGNSSIANGTTQNFYAHGVYSDNSTQDLTGQVAWSSTDPAVATPHSSGGIATLTSHQPGTTTLIATHGNISGQTSVTVTAAALQYLELQPSTVSLPAGHQQQISLIGHYTDSTTQDLSESATWTSSNPEFASVSNVALQRGLLTAYAPGTTRISVQMGSWSAQKVVTVTDATLQSLAIQSPLSPLPAGLTYTFSVIGTYSDGTHKDVSELALWASSHGSILSVSNATGEHGKAYLLSPGSATLSTHIGSVSANLSVTVSSAVLQSITVAPSSPSVALGLDEQFTATGNYSDNSQVDITNLVTWVSTNPSVGSISNASGSHGLFSSTGTGTTQVRASLLGVNQQTTVTVTPPRLLSLIITPGICQTALGIPLQLAAIGTYTNGDVLNVTAQANWNSQHSTIASVNASGLLSTLLQGSSNITAQLDGITASRVCAVQPALLVSISVTPAHSVVVLLGTKQYTATGTYSDGTTANITTSVNWSTSNVNWANFLQPSVPGLLTCLLVTNVTVTATLGGITGTATLN